MNVEKLIAFEDEVARRFNAAEIRAPVHLYSNNEEQLIKIFETVQKNDWIFCSWRSHYQCLLKGVPEDEVMAEIMAGRSISLCFPEYKVYSSAIVGGILPISVGVAMSIKRNNGTNKVYCFMGEMTAETGIAHESIKYCQRHDLPIKFIIEDNGKSVVTDTRKTWNTEKLLFDEIDDPKIIHYTYENKYPHAGAGKRVQF